MVVTEYLRATRMSISALSRATGIAYTTLQPHVKHGKPLSAKTAKKLQDWSGGALDAAEILGLKRDSAAPS